MFVVTWFSLVVVIHLFIREECNHSLRLIILSEDDRSVSCVVRSWIVHGRLGFVSRRPSSLVCCRSCVIACHLSYIIACPSLVCRRWGIVVICSLVGEYQDLTLFVVVGVLLFVVTHVSLLLTRCVSSPVLRSVIVDRSLSSLFAGWQVSLRSIVRFHSGFCVVWLYDASFRNMSFGMSGFRFVFFVMCRDVIVVGF